MAPGADPELTTESAAIALEVQVRVAALPSRRVWGTPLQKGFWSYMPIREGCPGNLEMLAPLMPKRKFSQKNGPCAHPLLGAGAQLSTAGMEQHFLAHRLQKPLSPHMQTCPVSKTSKTHCWEIVDPLLAQEQGYPLRGQGQANSGSHEVHTGPYLACG